MQATGQIRANWPSLKQTVRQQAVIGLMLGTGLSGEHVWQQSVAHIGLSHKKRKHSCCWQWLELGAGSPSCGWMWLRQQRWPLQLLL